MQSSCCGGVVLSLPLSVNQRTGWPETLRSLTLSLTLFALFAASNRRLVASTRRCFGGVVSSAHPLPSRTTFGYRLEHKRFSNALVSPLASSWNDCSWIARSRSI